MNRLRAAVERGSNPGFGRWHREDAGGFAMPFPLSHGDMRIYPHPKHHEYLVFGFSGGFAMGWAKSPALAMAMADDHLYAMTFFEMVPEKVDWTL